MRAAKDLFKHIIHPFFPACAPIVLLFYGAAPSEDFIGRVPLKHFVAEQLKTIEKNDFPPLPKPGPDDWLANHHEPGQTYDDFLIAPRHKPDRKRQVVCLAQIDCSGDKNPIPFAMLREFASIYFGMRAMVDSSYAGDQGSFASRINSSSLEKQYYAPDILDYLKIGFPDSVFCVLAVTMVDLYPAESWNYVFGLASYFDRVGVSSFIRYRGGTLDLSGDEKKVNDTIFNRRCLKIIAHETGHMFGLFHCTAGLCVMNGCNHLGELDRQPIHLCPACLKKLQMAVGFNVNARYKKLEVFYKKAGMVEEAEWVARRLQTKTILTEKLLQNRLVFR